MGLRLWRNKTVRQHGKFRQKQKKKNGRSASDSQLERRENTVHLKKSQIKKEKIYTKTDFICIIVYY